MHKLAVPEMSRLTLEMSNVDQHSILTFIPILDGIY
jgi:hypothetical protein